MFSAFQGGASSSGGVSNPLGVDLVTSAAIRIGPNTSDGADNSSITIGHSGLTRGGGIVCYGNESANAGQIVLQPGYSASGTKVFIKDFSGGNLATFDGFTGQASFAYVVNVGTTLSVNQGATIGGAITLVNTQSNPGNTLTSQWRDAIGSWQSNVPTGGEHIRRVNGVIYEELFNSGGSPAKKLYDASGSNAVTMTNVSGYCYFDLTNASGDYRFRNSSAQRIGGFPLTPGDLPVQKCRVSRTGSNQTSNSGSYAVNTANLNNVDVNTNSNLSWSSGVGTVVTTGVYDILAQLTIAGPEALIGIKVNSTIVAHVYVNTGGAAVIGQADVKDVSLAAGDTVRAIFESGSAFDLKYDYPALTIAAGYASFMEISRKQ